MQNNRVVKIFLASSIEDTKDERNKIENYIVKNFPVFFKNQGYEFKIFRCEDLTAEYFKNNQQLIDEEVKKSEIFVVVFKNSVGEYTFHEFEVARDQALRKGLPHIFPFVSTDLMNESEEHPNLKKMIENNNYIKTFDNVDTVILSLLQSLGNLLSVDIRTSKNGELYVNGVKERIDIRPEEISKQYLIRQKDYIDYAAKAMSYLYESDKHPLARYFDMVFPDMAIFADDSVRFFGGMDFDLKRHSKLLKEQSEPMDEDSLNSLKEKYAFRNNKSIISYEFYDYMNNEIHLNEEGKITGIDMFVGSDIDNVFSTLTLRDEFENLYEKRMDAGKNLTFSDLLDEIESPIRTLIHKSCGGNKLSPFLEGDKRSSAFGLQLIVLFKVKDQKKLRENKYRKYLKDNKYWTTMAKRSDEAREQPGFYQLAPCGGFNVFADSTLAKKDREVQEDFFDYFDCIVRNYVTGLFSDNNDGFGSSKYDIPEKATLEKPYMADKHADELFEMIEKGSAKLEFLGLSASLLALKSDLVFLLKIDDEDYYSRNKQDFRGDYNSAKLDIYPLNMLYDKEFLETDYSIAEEIAAPLELLKESKLMRE